MSGVPVERAYDIAAALLAAAVAGLTGAGREVPGRRYVSDGVVAWDCEQLVVQLESIGPVRGDPTQQGVFTPGCIHMRAGNYAIHHVHCVPTVGVTGAPGAAVLNAAGRKMLGDASAIWDGVRALYGQPLFPKDSMAIAGWGTPEVSGGFAGGILRVICGFDAIVP